MTLRSNRQTVSVVIGFRDWGITRIRRCIESFHASVTNLDVEVIAVDYGSKNTAGLRAVIEATGAIYLRIETDGPWSRSKALNAGASSSAGEYIIFTDADMLVSPSTVQTTIDHLESRPNDLVIVQCRDLPEPYSDRWLERNEQDWQELEEVSKLRPRWGTGGFVAHRRTLFQRLRGLDERMHTYGAEDTDYALRARRLGHPVVWLDNEDARIYHVWHPHALAHPLNSADNMIPSLTNHRLMRTDPTFVRNWRKLPASERLDCFPVLAVFANINGVSRDAINSFCSSLQEQNVSAIDLVLYGMSKQEFRDHFGAEFEEEVSTHVDSLSWHRGLDDVRDLISTTNATYCYFHDFVVLPLPYRFEALLSATSNNIDCVYDMGSVQPDAERVSDWRESASVGVPTFTGVVWSTAFLHRIRNSGLLDQQPNQIQVDKVALENAQFMLVDTPGVRGDTFSTGFPNEQQSQTVSLITTSAPLRRHLREWSSRLEHTPDVMEIATPNGEASISLHYLGDLGSEEAASLLTMLRGLREKAVICVSSSSTAESRAMLLLGSFFARLAEFHDRSKRHIPLWISIESSELVDTAIVESVLTRFGSDGTVSRREILQNNSAAQLLIVGPSMNHDLARNTAAELRRLLPNARVAMHFGPFAESDYNSFNICLWRI